MSSDSNSRPAGLSTERFFHALVQSGLFHEAELIEVRERFGADVDPDDCSELCARLVREGVLTEFQAERLAIGRYQGLVCGRYAVLDRIGGGAMGLVYKARHRLMDRIVALKMVSTQPKKMQESVARFFGEMKIVGRLDHPNVVRAFDADVYLNRPYIVMEYLEGEDFEQYLNRRGPLPPKEVIGLMEQAAWGLEHAHEKGIVHRDIKPTNLFLEKSGVVKILDLGLGAFVADANDEARLPSSPERKVRGTADYMSPEQISGQAIDTRTDLFSLGCAMYRLLTGAYAFPGATREIRLIKRQSEKHVPVTTLRPTVPYGLVQLLDGLLATSPDDRFSHASEVAEALEALNLSPDGPVRSARSQRKGRKPASCGRAVPPGPEGPPLDSSLIESSLRPDKATKAGGAPAENMTQPTPPRPAEAVSVSSLWKRLEADGEESGREVHRQYRKEVIQLIRTISDDQTDRQQPEVPSAGEHWIERVGERLGDFFGEPEAVRVLIIILLVLLILVAAIAIALN
jgi:serine/threonine-protein kinase